MRFPFHPRTIRLLKGLQGLEIGASSHNPYGVDSQNVAPKNKARRYAQEQINMCGEAAKIDIDGYAHKIPVEDNSVDFVLSSHSQISRLFLQSGSGSLAQMATS